MRCPSCPEPCGVEGVCCDGVGEDKLPPTTPAAPGTDGASPRCAARTACMLSRNLTISLSSCARVKSPAV